MWKLTHLPGYRIAVCTGWNFRILPTKPLRVFGRTPKNRAAYLNVALISSKTATRSGILKAILIKKVPLKWTEKLETQKAWNKWYDKDLRMRQLYGIRLRYEQTAWVGAALYLSFLLPLSDRSPNIFPSATETQSFNNRCWLSCQKYRV